MIDEEYGTICTGSNACSFTKVKPSRRQGPSSPPKKKTHQKRTSLLGFICCCCRCCKFSHWKVSRENHPPLVVLKEKGMSQGSPHLKTPAPLLAFIISTLQQQLLPRHSLSFHNKQEEDLARGGAAGFVFWSVLEVVVCVCVAVHL